VGGMSCVDCKTSTTKPFSLARSTILLHKLLPPGQHPHPSFLPKEWYRLFLVICELVWTFCLVPRFCYQVLVDHFTFFSIALIALLTPPLTSAPLIFF
jgi:hypothetical protein